MVHTHAFSVYFLFRKANGTNRNNYHLRIPIGDTLLAILSAAENLNQGPLGTNPEFVQSGTQDH